MTCRLLAERSGGMLVEIPRFRLTFWRDGRAELAAGGGAFGTTGANVGTVRLRAFGKLYHLLHEVDFDEMGPRYSIRLSDAQTETITAVMDSGERTVVDYGGAGPVELWSVQRAMEALAWTINWEPR